ncbi:myosin-11-like isoform X1 [Papaver somniferum]|uniref:myosin-11-like isoform X1 n=2 Tax=Papaver somniferum TaxID=3469 RepID=UPI000E6F9F0C|nr:myosin-11-like isoform X1 [Papaver somniferum]
MSDSSEKHEDLRNSMVFENGGIDGNEHEIEVTESTPYLGVSSEDVDSAAEEGPNGFATNHSINAGDAETQPPATKLDHQESLKEDMFVDASDELDLDNNRKNIDVEQERPVVSINETQDESHHIMVEAEEEKVGTEESGSSPMEDGGQTPVFVDEVSQLRAMLNKTVAEKDTMAHEYKVERNGFIRELFTLRQKLEVITSQHSPVETGEGQAENHHQEEKVEGVKGSSDELISPLQRMISDCSRLTMRLESVLNEKLQSGDVVKQLETVIFQKDQEIEDLNAKVNDLSVSKSAVESHMEALQQTLKESSEVHNESNLHAEVVLKRLLVSVSAIVKQEDLLDDSASDKLSLVERGISLMIENYNQFLVEIDGLKQCLTEVRSDFNVPEEKDFGFVFGVACEELFSCKRKEVDFVAKLNQLEAENNKLMKELDKEKETLEVVKEEAIRTKGELEQEKVRSANTKEKLGMAVTKGKALVQQRDSLKHSIAEKTNELQECLQKLQEKSDSLEAAAEELVRSQILAVSLQESLAEKMNELQDCLHRLQEKSNSLEAAEGTSEELVRSQNLTATLQELLSTKEAILKEIEDILPEGMLAEHQSTNILERVRWLVDHKNKLDDISFEFHKVKDVLSAANLPETVLSSNLDSQINWLKESFSQAKVDITKLQGEVASAWVSVGLHESELAEARNEIDLLSVSLSAEKEEKGTLQMALYDLSRKYEAVSENEHRVSSEKDGLIRKFLEASEMQNPEDSDQADIAMLVEKCIKKIKEQNSTTSEVSLFGTEQFERMQSLLYIQNQKLVLCENILEEEMVEKSKLMNLASELERVSRESDALKDENKSLQNDLERAEDKTALVREKLSMAVKKGKGMVQERENLKRSIDERNIEIENLKQKLEQQESVVSECRDQINKLSPDLESMSNLESDLVAMKEQRDQFQQSLQESNNTLQIVVKSIDIAITVDATFEDPVEKVKWLLQCYHDFQAAKSRAEQELETVNQENISMSSKLEEADATIKSLENELSKCSEDLSLLTQAKQDIEVSKAYVEEELEKSKEEAGLKATKFTEVLATIKSLEEAESSAERRISVLVEEKAAAGNELEKAKSGVDSQASELAEANRSIKSLEEAVSSAERRISILVEEKAAAENELEKAKAGVDSQAGELAEANRTIKSLEDALSRVEKHASVLSEERNDSQVARDLLEKELEEAKTEASVQASKVSDAYTTIKSLEDALANAENDIAVLVNEKRNTEQEIAALNAKLSSSVEELAGTRGASEGQSVELLEHLNDLEMLMKDSTLLFLLTQGFKKKLESLRDMHLLLEGIRDRFVEEGSGLLPAQAGTEKDHHLENLSPTDLENFHNDTMHNSEGSAADSKNISSYFKDIIEGFNMKNKLIKDSFVGFSGSMDDYVAVLTEALQQTMDGVVATLETMESLKQQVKNVEIHNHEQESVIDKFQNDVTMMLSACKDIVDELRFEDENLNSSLFSGERKAGGDAVEEQRALLGTQGVKVLENVLSATKKFQSQNKQLESLNSACEVTIEDLQTELEGTKLNLESVTQERDLHQSRASKLETALEELKSSCNSMNLKLDECLAMEDVLREKEAELSSLHVSLASKSQEKEGRLLSEGQIQTLLEKINGIEIPFRVSELKNTKSFVADPVQKLFYVVDTVAQMQHQLELSAHDKEELQSRLSESVQEIEHLKKEAGDIISINQELEHSKSDLAKLAFDLEKIIQKFGGDELIKEQKSVAVRNLLPVLEKLIKDLILESENSKARAQELGVELHGNKKFMDELSAKVALLEVPVRKGLPPSDAVQDRSILEGPSLASGSEISEIETIGPAGRNSTSPAASSSAAHVRSMRKGSSDHLALTIDSESDRLLNVPETDDDKGHVFKSLNTSGLVPKQGKLLADRIDGIWVSGGRILMSRPRARIGVVAYCLLLHIWLLANIL